MTTSELRARVRSGFTLIEVTLTIFIMSLLLVSITEILVAARTSRDTIYNIQETQLAGPAILDLIERDLRGIFTTSIDLRHQLRVRSRVTLGQDADSLDFVTTTDSKIWRYDGDRALRADVNEVGYRLRPSPESDDFLELYRREGFGIDEEPFDGGSYTFLHDRIKSFDVLAYAEDGPDAEPLEEWNTDSSDIQEFGLPARLEISMTLELAPRIAREQLAIAPVDRRTITYRRVIRLPEGLRRDVEHTPRIAIPSSSPQPGPGGGGGDEQEGGDDGGAGNGAPSGDEGGGGSGDGRGSGGGGLGGKDDQR